MAWMESLTFPGGVLLSPPGGDREALPPKSDGRGCLGGGAPKAVGETSREHRGVWEEEVRPDASRGSPGPAWMVFPEDVKQGIPGR